ncbi:hypothetical protein GCM10009742_58920 [Kribbella karoonensis]|uniref:Uncharacterized protein n=1 Tax=Kribbella karoonensis TaxID=324851 RepID=A0ABP4QCD0_9ACTN
MASFDLLDETTATGSHAIDREYLLWLQQQSWHDLDLERLRRSPAPSQLFSLDEAAKRLGVQRSALRPDGLRKAAILPRRRRTPLRARRRTVL